MRDLIDSVTRRVCPGCDRCCCNAHYCRETVRNPWYRAVNQVCGRFSPPADWGRRREPFALGVDGCRLRAGRYVFCYSYNCPLIRQFVAARGVLPEFEECSDLLLAANRLPGGRFLHELRVEDQLTPADLHHIRREVDRALTRLADLQTVLRTRPES